jgi:hypothetical protein
MQHISEAQAGRAAVSYVYCGLFVSALALPLTDYVLMLASPIESINNNVDKLHLHWLA